MLIFPNHNRRSRTLTIQAEILRAGCRDQHLFHALSHVTQTLCILF
ncbi:Uncharacterised protein [Vibrio cholerae]|nr:Uncharacterised protein [Vibrio cholerae]